MPEGCLASRYLARKASHAAWSMVRVSAALFFSHRGHRSLLGGPKSWACATPSHPSVTPTAISVNFQTVLAMSPPCRLRLYDRARPAGRQAAGASVQQPPERGEHEVLERREPAERPGQEDPEAAAVLEVEPAGERHREQDGVPQVHGDRRQRRRREPPAREEPRPEDQLAHGDG